MKAQNSDFCNILHFGDATFSIFVLQLSVIKLCNKQTELGKFDRYEIEKIDTCTESQYDTIVLDAYRGGVKISFTINLNTYFTELIAELNVARRGFLTCYTDGTYKKKVKHICDSDSHIIIGTEYCPDHKYDFLFIDNVEIGEIISTEYTFSRGELRALEQFSQDEINNMLSQQIYQI